MVVMPALGKLRLAWTKWELILFAFIKRKKALWEGLAGKGFAEQTRWCQFGFQDPRKKTNLEFPKVFFWPTHEHCGKCMPAFTHTHTRILKPFKSMEDLRISITCPRPLPRFAILYPHLSLPLPLLVFFSLRNWDLVTEFAYSRCIMQTEAQWKHKATRIS